MNLDQLVKSAQKPLGIALGVVVVGGLAWLIFGDKLKAAAAAVGTAINPASDQNLAYRGVGAVGGAISGQGAAWSLGSQIYDWLHPEEKLLAEIRRSPDERAWYEQIFVRGG